jgi:hypothetical protein
MRPVPTDWMDHYNTPIGDSMIRTQTELLEEVGRRRCKNYVSGLHLTKYACRQGAGESDGGFAIQVATPLPIAHLGDLLEVATYTDILRRLLGAQNQPFPTTSKVSLSSELNGQPLHNGCFEHLPPTHHLCVIPKLSQVEAWDYLDKHPERTPLCSAHALLLVPYLPIQFLQTITPEWDGSFDCLGDIHIDDSLSGWSHVSLKGDDQAVYVNLGNSELHPLINLAYLEPIKEVKGS